MDPTLLPFDFPRNLSASVPPNWLWIQKKNLQGQGAINDRFKNAQTAWRQANYEFGILSHGQISYKRVLGWGGFGVVTLWQLPDIAPGLSGEEFAVKFPIARPGRAVQDQELRREIEWMGGVFRNSQHFIQLMNVGGLPRSMEFNNPQVQAPIIVMEVASKFSLYELISRINTARKWNRANPTAYTQQKLEFIPSRILWRMFLCLTRAVVGMAYPVIPPPAYGPRRETVQPPGSQFRNIVHFDLDPQNVLCGEFDFTGAEPEHVLGPLVKVADYGLMLEWNDQHMDEARKARHIKRGKPSWYAPEQRQTEVHIRNNAILGYPMNIWAIGLIMFNLLTLRHPEDSGWYPLRRDRDPTTTMTPITQVNRIWTWGWQLVPDGDKRELLDSFLDAFDYDLRWLIARCMSSDTRMRPSIHSLLELVEFGVRQADERATRLAAERDAEAEVLGAQMRAGIWTPVGPQVATATNLNMIPRAQVARPQDSSMSAQASSGGPASQTGLPPLSGIGVTGVPVPGIGLIPGGGVPQGPALAPLVTTNQIPPRIEDDDLIRRFYNNYFHEPPPDHDPWRDFWHRNFP